MSLFEDTNPRELKELLSQIERRESALPDFQRDFVWDPNATQELIVSIASNYPAGSLLRIRNTHNLFACREFQGAPVLDGHRTTYLVLDGQQRLTSLYQAFYGVGDHRYFLDLRKLLDGADFEEAIFHIRANTRWARDLENFETQADSLNLPLSILKDGTSKFSQWTRRVARRIENESKRVQLEDSLDDQIGPWIQTIDDYKFPVVTLSDETSAEAVCTIFETLNRTGVKLSPFELLTARFWPKNVNLRHLWQRAQDEHPIIADFQVDPYYLLQVVALVSRSTPSCKRSDVLDLEANAIREWWSRSTNGLGEALKLLRDDCGVLVPGWLPYSTILIPLAAVLAKHEITGTARDAANRQKLVRWFWCSVFGQAYENAPNSQAVKDMGELLAWLQDAPPPETVREFRFDPRMLRDTGPRQRAAYRGAMCLVLSGYPRDFYSAKPLTGELIVEHQVDDHHIFPAAYLDRHNAPARLRDCVLNRTLIDRRTNVRISKREPSDYMKEIRTELGDEDFQALLESHLISCGPDSPIWHNDFAEFLALRQEALWKEIQRVTGVQSASQLIEEDVAA